MDDPKKKKKKKRKKQGVGKLLDGKLSARSAAAAKVDRMKLDEDDGRKRRDKNLSERES